MTYNLKEASYLFFTAKLVRLQLGLNIQKNNNQVAILKLIALVLGMMLNWIIMISVLHGKTASFYSH